MVIARAIVVKILCLGAFAACPAVAQQFGGSVGFVSDRIVRGLSLSAGRPTVTAEGFVSSDEGWNAGASAALYRTSGGHVAHAWSANAGKNWQLDADLNVQVSAAQYLLAFSGVRRTRQYSELSVSAAWQSRFVATLAATQAIGVAPSSSWGAIDTIVAEVGWHERLTGRVALDVGLGVEGLGRRAGRARHYGNVSVSTAFGRTAAGLSLVGSERPDTTQSGRSSISHVLLFSIQHSF